MNATTISPSVQQIIVAALKENKPNSIIEATKLALITVYAGIKKLENQHLAVYDKEAKTVTLTEEGVALAKQLTPEPEPTPVTQPAASNVTIIITGGTKKARAWEIIDRMQALHAQGVAGNRRKDIVAVIAAEFGIKDNAASQYIQHHRQAHGLVTPRVTTAAVEEVLVDTTGSDPLVVEDQSS